MAIRPNGYWRKWLLNQITSDQVGILVDLAIRPSGFRPDRY